MPDHADREAATEAEIERQADEDEVDPLSSREALEEDLMEEGRSAEGKYIP